MRLPAKVLYEIVPNFLRDGWQVVSLVAFDPRFLYVNFVFSSFSVQNIHAIGDRANAIILDAFENALKNADVTALRPRLEHAQIMNEADIARLGKLGGKSTGSIHLQTLVLINRGIQSLLAFNQLTRESRT